MFGEGKQTEEIINGAKWFIVTGTNPENKRTLNVTKKNINNVLLI